MPIVQVKTNQHLKKSQIADFLAEIALSVSQLMHKPEEDVKVMYSYFDIWMANSNSTAAFIDIRFVSGLDIEMAANLCNQLGVILQKHIEIDLSRVYINFFDVPEEHAWRFKNGTAVCPK